MRQEGSSGGEPSVTRVVETRLPTRHGTFRILGYRDRDGAPGGVEHVALTSAASG